MAENGHFSDDISALWGEPAESDFLPPPPTPASAPEERAGHAGNGSATPNGAGTAGAAGDLAQLAEALAIHSTDVVSRAELATVRSELEGAFTHQLAVALYDLLNASSDRFASVEAHIGERLAGIAERLDRSVEGQAERLAALLESQGAESAQRADEHAEAQQRQSERTEAVAAEGSARLEEISARVESVQEDMTALKQAVEELRSAQAEGRRKGRRWGRTV